MTKTIREIDFKTDKKVSIYGWVRFNRNSKSIGFIELFDGSTLNGVQVVYKEESLKNFNEIGKLSIFTAIKVEGEIVTNPKNNTHEIIAFSIETLKESDASYPLQKKEHTVEFLRENAHLRVRTKYFYSIFKIRSEAYYLVHDFFRKQHFINCQTPLITSNDCEGAGEAFTVSSQNKKVNFFNTDNSLLTVSGQLHAEAFAQNFQKVYTFGPTFRAEKSNTTKHLAEFWMLEPEIAFASLQDVIDLSWNLIQFVTKGILESCKEEINFLSQFTKEKNLDEYLKKVCSSNLQQITYTNAIELLNKNIKKFEEYLNDNFSENKHKFKELLIVKFGDDLGSEHERFISEKLFQSPVALTDYPTKIKAFYMKLNNDANTVASFDLLFPGFGELIGGSQRESDIEKIISRVDKDVAKGLNWYIEDLRKYGYYQSAGFGLGFERFLMFLTGVTNIKDVIAFPRSYNYLYF